MGEPRFCPDCGTKVADDERFCPNCGAEVPTQTAAPAASAPAAHAADAPALSQEEPMIGAGARVNATGGIHRTSHQHVNVSNQQVDNSSNISNTTNNTTIVMNGTGEAKYCEVCGNPLEEKHPRCPKCGKQICFDCKVQGKNRCVECEKKAREEYRIAFQQLLLTTNGNLGAAGRQMMNNKARELDVEDVKADLEKELQALFRPAKPEQPAVAAPATAAATAAAAATVAQRAGSQAPAAGTKGTPKGLGALSGGEGIRPQPKGNEGGGNRTLWFLLGGVAAVAVIAFLAFGGKGEKTGSAPVEPQAVEQAAEPTAAPQSVTPAAPQATPQQSAAKPTQSAQPAAAQPATDASYEAGMKAYKAGEGLEAIECFKKSGSAKANYMLGIIYESGCGNVGSNAMMARKYFKKAAQQGSAEAKAKL